jgi:hypothetical protein
VAMGWTIEEQIYIKKKSQSNQAAFNRLLQNLVYFSKSVVLMEGLGLYW